MVLFDNSDVITTSGGKEIAIYDCNDAGGSYMGSTDKECYYGNSSIV